MYKYLFIVLFSNLVILFIYSQFQESMEFNDGKGFDGQYYYEITQQIENNDNINSKSPFQYRVGTSYLVSFLFDDIKLGFIVINIFFSIALSLLIYLLANIFLNNYLSIIISIIYQLHWVSGIRYILFDPIGTDYIALFLIYLSLYIILKDFKYKYQLVLAISSFGVFFREIAMLPMFALFLIDLYKGEFTIIWKKIDLRIFSRLIELFIPYGFLALITFAVNDFEFFKDSDNNTIVNAIKWLYIKGIGQYVHSVFNVVGLFLVIPIAYRKQLKDLDSNYKVLYIFSILILFLAIIGGSDTERFIAWGLPIYSIIIVKLIIDNKMYKSYTFYFIVMLSVLTFRLFWITPNKMYDGNNFLPIFTFIANDFNFADLFAMHGEKKFTSVALMQYLIVSAITLFFIKIRNRNEN